MPSWKEGDVLEGDQRRVPFIWRTESDIELWRHPDVSDEVLDQVFGTGNSRKLKSWGHDPKTGVHWLATRQGAVMHRDTTFVRYTHHLVLRNDGMRIVGLDTPLTRPLWPGALYCLDTHSPHSVIADPRMEQGPRGYKVQLVVDTDEPLTPKEAFKLLTVALRREPRDFVDSVPAAAPRFREHLEAGG